LKEQIVSELLEEARQRRAEAALLAAFDRELDETGQHVLRPRPGQSRLDQAIWAAEAASQVSAAAELGQVSDPRERLAKRAVERMTGWYMALLAGRVTRFAEETVRSLGHLSDALDGHAERVDALADRVDALVEELEAMRWPAIPAALGLDGAGHPVRASPLQRHPKLARQAVDRLKTARGLVLHADCGSGELVGQFLEEGIDAYGTDPWAVLVESPVKPGLDLRQAEAIGHLRSVAPGSLGGILLSGHVDRLTPGDARRLAFLVGTRVAPRGVIALVGTQPAAWQRQASPLELDLAPGRPLHPETWRYLLGEYGFTGLEAPDDPELDGFLVTGTRAR
jgi:hypothetical protein